MERDEEKTSFFLKKKEAKKTFSTLGLGQLGCTECGPKHTKVLCFFSSEKKILSLTIHAPAFLPPN